MNDKKRGNFTISGFGDNQGETPHPLDTIANESGLVTVRQLPLESIRPDPGQPRKVFEDIEELASSIKKNGVLQPIIVKRAGSQFQILCGERRWRASKKAEQKTIPAIIKEGNHENSRELSLIENIQRRDLSPIEESLAIKELSTTGYKQVDITAVIGKNKSYVSRAMKIAEFAERHGNVEELIKLRMADGSKIGMEHFFHVASQPTYEEGRKLLNKIINFNITQKKLREETKKTQVLDTGKVIKHFQSIRKTIPKKLVFDFKEELEVKEEEKGNFLEEIEKTATELKYAFQKAMNELIEIKKKVTD